MDTITYHSWGDAPGYGVDGVSEGGGFTVGYSQSTVVVPEPSAFLYGGLISVLAGCGYRFKRRLA